MDKKRNKFSSKSIIHKKRVLKERMKACYVTGKSLQFVQIHHKYINL